MLGYSKSALLWSSTHLVSWVCRFDSGQQEHEMKPRMCLRREQKHRVELNIKMIH